MNLLFIGNSLTFYHDMPEMLAAMQQARGKPIFVRQLTRSWHSLSHYLQPQTEPANRLGYELKFGRWDWVILQDHSSGPYEAPVEFQEAVRRLDEKVRRKGAKPVLFETWAYREDTPRLAELGISAQQLQEVLNREYKHAAEAISAPLVPAGEAFARAKKKETPSLLEQDGIHPSVAGSYLTAAVFARVLFGETEPGGYVPEGLTAEEVSCLWEIAAETADTMA